MSKKIHSPGEFCWNELMTNDVDKSKAFYGELLGWEANDMDMGDMTYSEMKMGDKSVAGLMPIPAEQKDQVPPHWNSYIMVDDIDATLAKAQSLGAEMIVPVTPIGKVGKLAVIVDPTGAPISFWQSLKD